MTVLCLQRESNTAPRGRCCKKKEGFVHCTTVLCQVLWDIQMQVTFPRLCVKIYPLLLSFLWEQPKLNWSWRNYPLKELKQASYSTLRPLHTCPLPGSHFFEPSCFFPQGWHKVQVPYLSWNPLSSIPLFSFKGTRKKNFLHPCGIIAGGDMSPS